MKSLLLSPIALLLATGTLFSQDQAPPSSPALGTLTNSEVERAHRIESRLTSARTEEAVLTALRAGWSDPPATYRPHAIWYWAGNAVTKEGISSELEQMKEKGLGGARIISFMPIYQKGNIEFGSPEFLSLVQYAVEKARDLGLEIQIEPEPGWNLGNQFVAPDDRSKSLVISEQAASGGELSNFAIAPPEAPKFVFNQRKKLEAVVAVKLGADDKPDCTQRVDLSAGIQGDRAFSLHPSLQVSGQLPDGKWKIMAFWTVFTGQHPTCAPPTEPPSYVVDYLNKDAVLECVNSMGSRYRDVVGSSFGQTVTAFAGDSPELVEDVSIWSTGLLERFKKEKGYDLAPYLPLLRYDTAPETPYVREDFGSFLSTVGMETFIDSQVDYTSKNNLQMMQQPHYRFTAELIEASGHLHHPETELTRRSFDPIAYPHKLSVSGAQFYPSKEKAWCSTEAFTFINDKYRVTMEEIKQASDLFVRDGISQFFDTGYLYTPEKELAPSRDLPSWGNAIGQMGTWWPYYRGLADYQSRALFLNREGRSAAQVLLYSPMPSIWSEHATFLEGRFPGGGGVRGVPFGVVPKLLVASGYDFDCVNDDLLQHATTIRNGKIIINGYSYGVLVLPRALCLAPETLKVIDQFVRSGGTVFALNTLPMRSTGLLNHEQNDRQVNQMAGDLFSTQGGPRQVEKGMTYFLPGCDGFSFTFSPAAVDWTPTETPSPAYQEFLKYLRARLQPAFEIADTPLSNGLTFRHTTIGPVDVWFICNLQPNPRKTEVFLKTAGQFPQIWDPMTGAIHLLPHAHMLQDGRLAIPVDLRPWESFFALITVVPDTSLQPKPEWVEDSSLPVEGSWAVDFSGLGGAHDQMTLDHLADWCALPGLRDFSGEATYNMDVDVPAAFVPPDKQTYLDLGVVHEVADVKINGEEAGVAWMEPYRVNTTGKLRAGKNHLEIHVVNNVWNYAAGLSQPTPLPPDILDHYGSEPTAKFSWTGLQKSKAKYNNDRLPSGLIGPVKLVNYRPVSL